jgi:TolB-like protein/Flp pilus assembly protein TadD
VTFAFGDHSVDIERRELRRLGQPVPIEPQVFDILVYLIRHRFRVVSKDDLIATIWGGRIVSDSALTTRINAVRRAIGDSGEAQQFIRTVPRRGVRFVGEVNESAADQPATRLAMPDKPSIAVLPFSNISGDPEQAYFADGMVEDIITALARIPWLFVIARNSSFTYRGGAADIKQVGRELGVRYVLEGSVRRAGGRVRITCQLIEAATSHHVWADRFESDLADIFALQDRITECVVGAVEPNLQMAEIRRAGAKPTENLDAYDFYLRALPHLYSFTQPGLDIAVALLGRSLGIDPQYSRAKGFLAWAYVSRHARAWDAPGERERALQLARDAVVGTDPDALRCGAHALSYFGGDHQAAFTALHRARLLHPNSAQVLNSLGWVHCMADDPEPAIPYLERALRLSPVDPEIGLMLTALGVAHMLAGRNEIALPFLQRAVQETPTLVTGHRHLILALTRLDRRREACDAAANLLRGRPGFHVGPTATQLSNRDYAAELRRALLAAGLPE